MALASDIWSAITGVLLIIELMRRLAGLALLALAAAFVAYACARPWLPGIFKHRGHDVTRFVSYFFTDNGARMVLQLEAVCARVGIIVGAIALTGIGARFSTVLLALADQGQILTLVFAMVVSVLLGMGRPTTAAYVVAASVIALGAITLGVAPLTAHLFIFYFAVLSAITPPVVQVGSDPIPTSLESFKIGLAAFVVP